MSDYANTNYFPPGAKVLYLEGFRTIHLANETFGHDGWTSEVSIVEIESYYSQ